MKTKLLVLAGLCAAVVFLVSAAATGNRQVTQNKLSPSAETQISLGGNMITIEYNAPSARARKVEGGLIPYGKVWRLGADAATTLTTTADIEIGDLHVPKGVHTLYLFAKDADNWELVVNKQTHQWGTEYSEGQDLGRVPMHVEHLSQPVEQLSIQLKAGADNSGTLQVEWGQSRATVPVKIA